MVVEALLSGTPIITPHFGAFAEINIPRETGFLCHTLRDYVRAIDHVISIDPQDCRDRGMRYCLDNVALEFEDWFADIREMYTGAGWMSLEERNV